MLKLEPTLLDKLQPSPFVYPTRWGASKLADKFSKFFNGQLGNTHLSTGFLTSDNSIGYSTTLAVVLSLCSDSNIIGYHHALFYYCTQC